ncbi:MAG: type II secretion system protein [Verrucomicrobiota bacterium]|nr:type II secretion system protein [Verrucomicrobiota bacterium]
MKTTTYLRRGNYPRKAFTMVEAIVVLTIFGLVLAGTMEFFMDTTKMSFLASNKNEINGDMRKVTHEMSIIARQANFFGIYKSISPGDRDTPGDASDRGRYGDLLVLGYKGDPPSAMIYKNRPTIRVVAYYRIPGANTGGLGPIHKLDMKVPVSQQYDTIESILPSESILRAQPKVVDLSEGLAKGKLFYNFMGDCIMVNAKIVHGSKAKEITDTYNFTISPRK